MTAQTIINIRKELGMTQSQLADELLVAQETISRWEQGHHRPHIVMQKVLKKLLKEHREKSQ